MVSESSDSSITTDSLEESLLLLDSSLHTGLVSIFFPVFFLFCFCVCVLSFVLFWLGNIYLTLFGLIVPYFLFASSYSRFISASDNSLESDISVF
jgi:hypothetical protein